ncbi:MAG: DNA repair protein RadA [Oscillospiraceae bacterium]|nr:DNA repair protein RadA [Oscillospiraceae bacterium]
MPKAKQGFICTVCGVFSSKYNGMCAGCGNWNCLESYTESSSFSGGAITVESETPVSVESIEIAEEQRCKTGISELDRVLGGGIVQGSLILFSGDPGIGKSTLALQISHCYKHFSSDNHASDNTEKISVLYVTGEESMNQLKLRAQRLGIDNENLYISCLSDIEVTSATIRKYKPGLTIIDSIQTMAVPSNPSLPGSVAQVRESAHILSGLSRELEIPIIVIGHVNKDGNIAGPKVLEHIVDVALYFEGERKNSFRILRAVKNRFGSTNEIGVFEMRSNGLTEIDNPSSMLLEGKPGKVSGTCAVCVMEGSRPIFAEVQALATKTGFGTPRRTCSGFDYNRMVLILAVLEKRLGYFFKDADVYVNVVGGLKLTEPAADLAVAMALVSSLQDKEVGEGVLSFGEIGLTGELRNVSAAETRIKEAQRLGFKKCIVPRAVLAELGDLSNYSVDILGVQNIRQAFEALG